ncbi:MAG: PRTRC system protein F [Desulfovibrionaceae bacterium]|nr:PRTRC system protein F [Desulfovibrionaceae bacterium]
MTAALQPLGKPLSKPLARPRAAPLTLPRLSDAIPRAVRPDGLSAVNARVARFLLDAQVFTEADIPDAWENALKACEQAMAARVQREIGPLRCLKPGFVMHLLDEHGVALGGYRQSQSADEPQTCREIEIYWGEMDEQQWPIGQGLQRLEAAQPDLGKTILQVLRGQCAWTYPLFTPDVACATASLIHWNGGDDEEAALDDMCREDSEQEREAMRSAMVTRAMLDRAYPQWAQGWMGQTARKLPERCNLRRAAKTITDPRLRQIVADAQALARLQPDERFRPEIDGEYIGFGAVLSWQEDDVTVRIYDDFIQMVYQSEFSDRIGEVCIALDDPGALGAWFRDMRPHFEAMRLIDRLIHGLSA